MAAIPFKPFAIPVQQGNWLTMDAADIDGINGVIL